MNLIQFWNKFESLTPTRYKWEYKNDAYNTDLLQNMAKFRRSDNALVDVGRGLYLPSVLYDMFLDEGFDDPDIVKHMGNFYDSPTSVTFNTYNKVGTIAHFSVNWNYVNAVNLLEYVVHFFELEKTAFQIKIDGKDMTDVFFGFEASDTIPFELVFECVRRFDNSSWVNGRFE